MHFHTVNRLRIAVYYCSCQRLFMMLEIKGGLVGFQEEMGCNRKRCALKLTINSSIVKIYTGLINTCDAEKVRRTLKLETVPLQAGWNKKPKAE